MSLPDGTLSQYLNDYALRQCDRISGHNTCNNETFSPSKKYASHFFNYACGLTGEKEAFYLVARKFEGVLIPSKQNTIIISFKTIARQS